MKATCPTCQSEDYIEEFVVSDYDTLERQYCLSCLRCKTRYIEVKAIPKPAGPGLWSRVLDWLADVFGGW